MIDNNKKPKTIVIRSISIAERMTVDYPLFKQLLGIKVDAEDPTQRKHVWIFRDTPEVEAAFREIVDDIKKSKADYQKKINEG